MKFHFLLITSLLCVSSFALAASVKTTRSIASERPIDMEKGAYAQIDGQPAVYFVEDYMKEHPIQSEDCGSGKYYEKCWKNTMPVDVYCVQFKNGNYSCSLKPTKKN